METAASGQDRGLVDMLDRILRVLLGRRSFKKNVMTVINNIDAAAAPRLARTVLWQDMGFLFGVVGAIPGIANTVILLLNEIVNQVEEKISPELLNGFVESLARDIDVGAARELKRNLAGLWERLEPALSAVFSDSDTPCRVESLHLHAAPQPVSDKGNENPYSAGSVLGEILSTSFIKDMLRESLNSARESTPSAAVRRFMWEDMEVFFSLIASLPLLVNSILGALGELGGQIDEKIQPALLKDYLTEVLGEIDTAGFSRVTDTYGKIMLRLLERDDVRELLMNSIQGGMAPSLGRGIDSAMKAINRAQERNGVFMSDTLGSIADNINGREAGRALMEILNPLLDRISLRKMLWGFVSGRIKYKIRRKK